MSKLWLLFPTKIICGIYNAAGDLQNQAADWLKFIEEKKIAVVDELYYDWHGNEDV